MKVNKAENTDREANMGALLDCCHALGKKFLLNLSITGSKMRYFLETIMPRIRKLAMNLGLALKI